MQNITDELKAKLLAAKSAEEAAELLKADGQELTAESAARLWEEITRKRAQEDAALSLDELEAVSGGARDWYIEGCAATVEDGSDCWGTDACESFYVTYERFDAAMKCPAYPGKHLYETLSREPFYGSDGTRYTKMIRRCLRCGTTTEALAKAGPLS